MAEIIEGADEVEAGRIIGPEKFFRKNDEKAVTKCD